MIWAPDVAQVEPRGGDVFRMFGSHYNRGLRSFEVDLRNPVGHSLFLELAGVSDVVLTIIGWAGSAGS